MEKDEGRGRKDERIPEEEPVPEEEQQSEGAGMPEDGGALKEELTQEDYQELIIQMRRMNIWFQRLSNIPAGELAMLLTVSRLLLQKSAVIPSDIGDAMKLSRPAVSRMLHNLEKKGYVRMESKKEDHRYVMVAFTQKGEKLIEGEMERCCKLLERVKEWMGEEDMQKFLCYYREFCTVLADEVLVWS